jgi:hypothetical protein
MRMKSNDNSFAINSGSLLLHQFNDLLVALVHTIKSSNGEYGISKKGYLFNIPVNQHK